MKKIILLGLFCLISNNALSSNKIQIVKPNCPDLLASYNKCISKKKAAAKKPSGAVINCSFPTSCLAQ